MITLEQSRGRMLRVRYASGAELTGPAVIRYERAVFVALDNGMALPVLNSDGSLPSCVVSVEALPGHVEGGLPLTDDMAYMAVTAMLRDAVGLTLGQASVEYERWVDSKRVPDA